MSVNVRQLAFTFLIALVLPGNILAQEELKKTVDPRSSNSIVTGRVVFDDTGSPAPRYRVQLIPTHVLAGPRSGFRMPTAVTGEDGEFSLKRVEAGEYYVVPQAIDARPGNSFISPFIGLTTDRAGDNERVEQFKKEHTRIVVDGQHNLTINLRVKNPNFGSISGRVIDASGSPAARAKVHLISKG